MLWVVKVLAVWMLVSVVVGPLVGRAMKRMGE